MNIRILRIISILSVALLPLVIVLNHEERAPAHAANLLAMDLPEASDSSLIINITIPVTTTNYLIRFPLISNILPEYPKERAALLALYNSTNGNSWVIQSGWNTPDSYCNWYGITCDEAHHVYSLDLPSNYLSGPLPPEIGDLEKLVVLNIKGDCVYIDSIQYCTSFLSGSIPPEIGNLSSLQYLDLSVNNLSGSIPIEIGNLGHLITLHLYLNQLSGSIPPEIGNLVNLQTLLVDDNMLSGFIPIEIGNLSNLQILNLSSNQLSGSLPHEIGNLHNLQSLWLPQNQLSGSIPVEIGNLLNLQELYLRQNLFSGSIPPEIGNLSKLSLLVLSNNQLSGRIPSDLSNLPIQDILDLGNNPELTCWETLDARNWALSINYQGPIKICDYHYINIPLIHSGR